MAGLDSRAFREGKAYALQDLKWAAANKPPAGFAYLIKDIADGHVKLFLSDGSLIDLQTGGGGGGNFTAITKNGTLSPPVASIALSTLSGPALLKFAADGTPSAAVPGVDYLTGSSGISWLAKQVSFAQANVDASLNNPAYFDPFMTLPAAVPTLGTTPVLAGQSILSDTTVTAGVTLFNNKVGGVMKLSSTAVLGTTTIVESIGATARPLINDMTVDKFLIVNHLKIAVAQDGTHTLYIVASMTTSSGEMRFSIDSRTDGGNHFILTCGTTTIISTTVPDLTAFHDYALSFDGTTIKAWIDGALVASTNNLGGATGATGYPRMGASNNLNGGIGTAFELDVDSSCCITASN